jgi:uncharacterized membrane protein YraQ (UPF0718 family)
MPNFDGVTLFLGILIEAFPFLLLGSLVSSALHVFVKTETLLRFIPKNPFGACVVSSLIGMFFTVCECGNVPVARQLIKKKLPPSASISFLLGAPILNPVVIITTVIAFPDNPEIWWGRTGLGFLVAVLVGYIMSFAPAQNFLVPSKQTAVSCCHGNKSKWKTLLDHTTAEFITMSSVMIVGAAIAASMQTFFPREWMVSIAGSPLLSILAMMGLAFVISICSTTDAFFALAYAHQFSPAALIAFLVFGPMIDVKALLLMRTTYSTKVLATMTILVSLIVLAVTYGLSLFVW